MSNHQNRSKKNRTVALKITEGGHLVQVDEHNTSALTIKVTGVPASVSSAHVAVMLGRCVVLGPRPCSIVWERIADAAPGSILRN